MLFDTDVLVWLLRGNEQAAQAIESAGSRAISVVNYMELLQGARDRREAKAIKAILAAFRLLPLTENIGHRASIYLEEFGLNAGLRMADALVAATAVESHLPLCTANIKHYRSISELEIRQFKP